MLCGVRSSLTVELAVWQIEDSVRAYPPLWVDYSELSRNSTDNSRKRNELHMESGGLFSDSL
jgi:hypothetical protein